MRIERFALGDRIVATSTQATRREPAPHRVAAIVDATPASVADLDAIEQGRARLVAPCAPSKIVCVGLNFRRHAEEMGKPLPDEPVLFFKPTTAILDPGGTILLPHQSSDVHFEGELAVVIGTRCCRASAAQAADHVLGYTVLNDVTARDLQRLDKRYTRAKGFDTFAPFGPAIVSGLDAAALRIQTRVNGAVRQDSSCDDFIFPIPDVLAYISDIMTLLPGDIVSTGTPAGVGALHPGDVVEVTIDAIGTLRNHVASR